MNIILSQHICMCVYVCVCVVQDLDAVEYSIQEEYEARVNFEALENMDPDIRARIDFDLLGQLTNTSPDLLAPYKQTDSSRLVAPPPPGQVSTAPPPFTSNDPLFLHG